MTASVPPAASALPVGPPDSPRTAAWTYLGSILALALNGVAVLLALSTSTRAARAATLPDGLTPADLARGATVVLVVGLVFVVLYALVKLALLRAVWRGRGRAALIAVTVLTGLEIVWFLVGIRSVGAAFGAGWLTAVAVLLQIAGVLAAVVAVVLFFRHPRSTGRG